MPIYEYQCQTCHFELEKLQKLSDAPLTECPECLEPALKKKISAAGFRLSGSGWYETDFKKGGNKKNIAGENAKSTESKSETKKESDTGTGSSKSNESKAAKTSASSE